jgi:hypothetical protein
MATPWPTVVFGTIFVEVLSQLPYSINFRENKLFPPPSNPYSSFGLGLPPGFAFAAWVPPRHRQILNFEL